VSRPREPLPTRIRDLPPLPPAAESTLDEGLERLGLSLLPGARDAVAGHLRLLLAWTAAINLTAIRDPLDAVTLHVLDSLAAVPLVRATGAERLLDLGSGGGYPGLPLAVAIPLPAVLVESIGKKARFLETAVDALDLRPAVAVAPVRAEALARDPAHRGRWPLVTARAVAALADLVELAFPLLAPGGRLLAWKREPIDAEMAGAHRAAGALGSGRFSVERVRVDGLDRHVLVVVEKRGTTPEAFPRDPAARERRPW
jgi:16S rRNA (guanine527-N7)-methyltransferase